jgi:hypothetical protein
MSEVSYWNDFQFIENEVSRAIELFYIADELNNLARENSAVLKRFNEAPRFWIMQRYAFDVALYIELGKIFDSGKDALSIHDLVQATVDNPAYFSKTSLRARKSQATTKPAWLDAYMDEVTEPTSVKLEALRNALSPFTKKMTQVYRPVRNKIVAHNIARDTSETEVLFAKTNREDIKELLYFLHDLVQNLWQLYHNGRIPKLESSDRNFHLRIREETRRAIQRLV